MVKRCNLRINFFIYGTRRCNPSRSLIEQEEQGKVEIFWGLGAFFIRSFAEATKKLRAQCKNCPTTLAIIQGSTSSLMRHAMKWAPKSGTRDPKEARLSTKVIIIGVNVPSYVPFDIELNEYKIMKMIVWTYMHFSFAKNPFFYGVWKIY